MSEKYMQLSGRIGYLFISYIKSPVSVEDLYMFFFNHSYVLWTSVVTLCLIRLLGSKKLALSNITYKIYYVTAYAYYYQF